MAFADSIINQNFSEMQWMRTMQRSLDADNSSDEIDLHCCIFRVPKSIKDLKPESYTPQRLAFGPYHHFRPDPYMAQKFKLKQVKTLQCKFNISKYKNLVYLLIKKVRSVRAFYNEQLDIRDDTLSWMMVIDGLFLLKLMDEELPLTGAMDSYGRKLSLDCIRTDAVMIENQIPLFVLEHLNSVTGSGSCLLVRAKELCKRVSPVDSSLEGMMMSEQPLHLLHLLYKFVCFEVETSSSSLSKFANLMRRAAARYKVKSQQETSTRAPTNFNFLVIPKKVVVLITNILHLLGFSKSTLQNTDEKSSLIPSASQLFGVNVKLIVSEAKKGIRSTQFRQADSTLVLPALTLNQYSDSVIRNLLGYEAMTMGDSPKFGRYIEMMAALIQTTTDVKLLKNKQILKHDGDNDEVVKLFEGIKDCINPSEGKPVVVLYKEIKEINEHYNGKWKIRYKRLFTKLVDFSLKNLTLLTGGVFYLLVLLDIYYSSYWSASSLISKLGELELPPVAS